MTECWDMGDGPSWFHGFKWEKQNKTKQSKKKNKLGGFSIY